MPARAERAGEDRSRYPMPEGKASDEDRDPCENRIEQIEGPHRADADEIEERTFHAQVGQWLMQALEYSICAMLLLCFVYHKSFVYA